MTTVLVVAGVVEMTVLLVIGVVVTTLLVVVVGAVVTTVLLVIGVVVLGAVVMTVLVVLTLRGVTLSLTKVSAAAPAVHGPKEQAHKHAHNICMTTTRAHTRGRTRMSFHSVPFVCSVE